MTVAEAKALAATEWWLHATPRQIAEFQMHEPLLCCPFGVFHEAVEKTLGRSVWTHEFGSAGAEGIKRELSGEKAPPSFDDICALIPPAKLIVLRTPALPEGDDPQ